MIMQPLALSLCEDRAGAALFIRFIRFVLDHLHLIVLSLCRVLGPRQFHFFIYFRRFEDSQG